MNLLGKARFLFLRQTPKLLHVYLAAIAETADTMLDAIRLAMQRMRGAYSVCCNDQ